MIIERNKYLNQLIIRKHNGLIKVITGIRRCGKSFLLNNIFYNHLLNEGVDFDHIIKFAFDSFEDLNLINEKFIDFSERNNKVNPEKFITYISSQIKDNKMYYLLLDEVQNMANFETVLNGLLRKSNLDIYVTGSNSKFLSTDVITEFRGRGDEIHIWPLSFSEFFNAYRGEKRLALDEYFLYGGLPALSLMTTDEQKIQYLDYQMKNVYLRDIITRYSLKDDSNVIGLLNVVASGISTLVNPLKLTNTFKSLKHKSLSVNTVSNYITYFEEAFLISTAKRYDLKRKKYINTPFKIYFEDVGLRNSLIGFRQTEQSHLMENIIYNELRYRGFKVDVGSVESYETNNENKRIKKQFEIDFVASLGSKKYYIQSSYDIYDQAKLIQETNSFDKINDSFKKIIIVSQSIKPRRNEKGYLIIDLQEFLLNENSLEL